MRKFIIILLSSLLLFSGCGQKDSYISRDIYAMSTVISINVPKSTKNAEELVSDAEEMIYSLEETFSATKKDSEISKLNSSNEGIAVSDEAAELFVLALDVAKNTNGAYNPACLSLTELWNISGGGYLPTKEETALALESTDHTAIEVKDNYISKASPNVKTDLGGVAKGYALEKTVMLLKENAEYGMVSFGGNVGVWGKKPDSSKWEIGIRDPFKAESVIGYLEIESGYVSVSGDYERYFEKDGIKYHHIFDTQKGYPADNGVHSVAVYTKNAALGDALSTALFVMGYQRSIELYESEIYEFEAVFVTDDGIFMTDGAKKIFTEK